jgi:enamine deaminase RidA (YjgF/YER057c/UK114 family)
MPVGPERGERAATDGMIGGEHGQAAGGVSMRIEERIAELGLSLPEPPKMPVETTFAWVRLTGRRILVSGHGAQQRDGSPASPFGRVPDEVTLPEAQDSAWAAALSVIASVRAAIGDLDQVTAWLSVTGFVNAAPGYERTTAVLNAFSQVVVDVFGDVGVHSRTAIGASALPLNLPVVVAAELEWTGGD